MRISPEAIAKLQSLFMQVYGTALSDEEAQQTGLKVIRYVYAKELQKLQNGNGEQEHESGNDNSTISGQ